MNGQINRLRGPLLVSWQITRDCDLACLHCCTDSAPGKRLPGELDAEEAMKLADRLAGLSPHSVRATKRALNLHLESAALAGFELALEAESQSFDTPELRATVQRHSGRAKGETDG